MSRGFEILASPRDGTALKSAGDKLVSKDHGAYPVRDGVADLLDPELMDDALRAEMEVFEKELPIENVSYFTDVLFEEAVAALGRCLETGRDAPRFVELGGGEGYLARAFAAAFPKGLSYVCDLSLRHLSLAPPHLVRVRCDARRPFFLPKSMDAAALWVSLHHFSSQDAEAVLDRAAQMLAPGGVLVLFEPNAAFFPRQVLLKTFLKRFVYYDEEEKAIDYGKIKDSLAARGFTELFTAGHNPPYNPAFLKKLTRLWPLFFTVTQGLHLLERAWKRGQKPWWEPQKQGPVPRLALGSYFFSLHRAPGGGGS